MIVVDNLCRQSPIPPSLHLLEAKPSIPFTFRIKDMKILLVATLEISFGTFSVTFVLFHLRPLLTLLRVTNWVI